MRLLLPLMVAQTSGYYVPISAFAESKLHVIARTAIKQSDHDAALQFYTTAVKHGHDSRSHLLLALHMQRCGAPSDETREAFRRAVAFDRDNAKLLQAWALYESKAGNMHAAVHLLRRAAQVDRSAMGALRWQIFRSFNRANNPLARPSKRGHATRGYEGYGI